MDVPCYAFECGYIDLPVYWGGGGGGGGVHVTTIYNYVQTLQVRVINRSALSSLKLHDVNQVKFTRHSTQRFNISIFIRPQAFI